MERPDPREPGHRHRYGSWSLNRSPLNPLPGATDSEYIATLSFPPMWMQECSCGWKNYIRWPTKPKTSFKFSEIKGSRVI